jgi:hypothetical protein
MKYTHNSGVAGGGLCGALLSDLRLGPHLCCDEVMRCSLLCRELEKDLDGAVHEHGIRHLEMAGVMPGP